VELALALVVLVVAAAAGALVWRPWRPSLPVLERYVVTLTTSETFEGLLSEARGGVLCLVDAYALDNNSRIKVDGELFLDRAKVAYMQKPGGGQ